MSEMSTTDLIDLTGISERRINYLCNFGVFGARNRHPGSGRRRSFSGEDVFVVAVLDRLASLGGLLSHQPNGFLSRPLAVGAAEAIRAGSGRWLVATTASVAVSDEIVPTGASIVVDLAAIVADLSAAVAADRVAVLTGEEDSNDE